MLKIGDIVVAGGYVGKIVMVLKFELKVVVLTVYGQTVFRFDEIIKIDSFEDVLTIIESYG